MANLSSPVDAYGFSFLLFFFPPPPSFFTRLRRRGHKEEEEEDDDDDDDDDIKTPKPILNKNSAKKTKKKTKQNKKNLQIVFGKQTRPRRRGEMENKEIPEEEKAPTIKRPLSRKQKTRQEVRRPT
jgi:hypothetical protein